VLVAAVLRPEQREDGQLEIVRLPGEQRADTLELPVGETEGAVQRLLGDRAQGASVTSLPDGKSHIWGSSNVGVLVNRRHAVMLIALALIWGSSFMFIKVAVRELSPSTLILGRLGLAALALAIVVPVAIGLRETLVDLRAHWVGIVVVGAVNTAVPFWLLSWGETKVDSGLASVIQASVPIFNAVLAFAFFHEQRVSGRRLAGVGVGFVGVALLVGAQPHAKLLGALAVVAMATCYGAGGLLTRRYLRTARPHAVALGTSVVAAVLVTPAGVAQAPAHIPGWKVLASVAVLGLLATACAYLLFFTIVAGAGADYAALVTYLVPPVALVYGAVFLGESVGVAALAGLALILGGVALGTRTPRGARRGDARVPVTQSP
jgi:drug/metabolite transporter (DMT)-like permease